MCELFGVVARKRQRLNEILSEFYSHSHEHPDGWGLACFSETGIPSTIEREPVPAYSSSYLKHRLECRIEEKTVIAHIRKASVGRNKYDNCHPFTATDNCGRTWTLAHNGTIFNGELLNGYAESQHGDTDSERILFYLVDRINREQNRLGRALGETERFDTLEAAVAELAKGNKINLLFFDGDVFYAHVNLRDTLHYRLDGDTLFFSTKPLSEGKWDKVPFTRLIAAKDGTIVREGQPHGHEYIHNPEDYRPLYEKLAGPLPVTRAGT